MSEQTPTPKRTYTRRTPTPTALPELEMPSFELAFMELQQSDVKTVLTRRSFNALSDAHRADLQSNAVANRALLDDMSADLAYEDGNWHGLESILRWVWTKFIAPFVKDQMLANFLFTVFVQGVSKALERLREVAKKYHPSVSEDVVDVMQVVVEVATNGSIDKLKADLEAVKADVATQTAADASAGKTPSRGRGLWNGFKAFLRLLNIIK
jgi:hypothetical protein